MSLRCSCKALGIQEIKVVSLNVTKKLRLACMQVYAYLIASKDTRVGQPLQAPLLETDPRFKIKAARYLLLLHTKPAPEFLHAS